jgi:hypothetical protein
VPRCDSGLAGNREASRSSGPSASVLGNKATSFEALMDSLPSAAMTDTYDVLSP